MKIPVKLPIQAGKNYYTKSGTKIRIYATDAGWPYPIHGAVWEDEDEKWKIRIWELDGTTFDEGDFSMDIVYEDWAPEDKELVWCWNNEDRFVRELKFYDAKNHCVFRNLDGDRGGKKYDNYAPFEYEYPEWAKEAYEELKNGEG